MKWHLPAGPGWKPGAATAVTQFLSSVRLAGTPAEARSQAGGLGLPIGSPEEVRAAGKAPSDTHL